MNTVSGAYGKGGAPDTTSRPTKSAVRNVQEQMAAWKNIDYTMIPIFSILIGGVTVFLIALTVGDWDYWQDWR
ncbi:MAG: hypothetical protein WBV19_04530, partial [Candidatus Macondimonas sp.]